VAARDADDAEATSTYPSEFREMFEAHFARLETKVTWVAALAALLKL
jgi:hypothetical protein